MFAWPQVLRWMRAEDFPLLVNHFLTQNFWETFPGPGVAALTFLVDGFLIVYFLGAKGFCTYGCPYGAVFNLADRVAAGRIRVTDACEGCAHCTATCTSNVHVAQEVARYGMVVDAGCMKCMDCVNVCPKEALYFGFGTPSISTAFAGRRRKIYDFSWKEELLLALAFLAALYAFRGLYNLIPFLLALGLGVLAAVGVLVASRLCLQKQVNFQFYSLRQQGNLTRAGWIATFVILPFLVFAAHSGAVQFHTRHGASLLHQSRTEQGLDAQRDREAARRSLDRAERWGLLPDNNLQRLLAGACRDAQDYSQMEVHLRRAIAVQPDEQSLLALSHLQFTRGDLGAARGTLEALLELDPNHEVAAQRLQTLKQMQDP
jgi:NAD-dependent dihydropyrimidine dehydrogenase PreA subunit